VTNGHAFYWSCAFYCEGGSYYATTGCQCACMTPEQETTWQQNGGTSQTPNPGNVSSAVDVVTRPPESTRAPYIPVVEIPVGEFGGESNWVPPKQSYTMPPTPSTPPPEDTEDPADSQMHLGMLALLFGGVVICTAIVGLFCFNWGHLQRQFRREKVRKWAETPVLSLHQPVEQCPQPQVEPGMPPGRTPRNSKGSIGSISTIESQRVTSKKSSQYAAPKALKDTRSLLKPPQNEIGCNSSNVSTCSGTWSTTSSNSHTFWAEPAPNGPNGRHGHHQDLSGRSTRKISKVQPM